MSALGKRDGHGSFGRSGKNRIQIVRLSNPIVLRRYDNNGNGKGRKALKVCCFRMGRHYGDSPARSFYLKRLCDF